uniref:Uncharacterized protein n=1 Tax=Arundo donax TaxID=35708 RepID=A0A0A9G2N6_ARUDO
MRILVFFSKKNPHLLLPCLPYLEKMTNLDVGRWMSWQPLPEK